MNNTVVDFKVLELIPKILESLEDLKKDNEELRHHFNPTYDLTTRAGVRNYLEITDSTISLYIKNGTFREGYHFFKEIKQNQSRIKFVSGAIEKFKKSKER